MKSDEQLMLEFRHGAREAFAELFERYRERLYGFFRRRVNHTPRAEELTQETFLAVLRGADRYEPRALFRTYLYAIALHMLAAERRKQGREAGPLLSNAEREVRNELEAGLWIRNALEQLEGDQREVLLLREYEQLSYSEIADVLRVPVNTVRSRLFRARMALKALLVPQQGNP